MSLFLQHTVLPRLRLRRFFLLCLAFGFSLCLTSGPTNQAAAQYPFYHVPPGGGNFGWTDYCARCGRQIDSGRLSAGCPFCNQWKKKPAGLLKRYAWPIGIGSFILVSALIWALIRRLDKRDQAKVKTDATEYSLGVGYDGGDGVSRNEADAAKSLRFDAEQGNVRAQVNLGKRYYYGQGVPEDEVEAYKWFLLANAQGSGIAKKLLLKLERLLSPEQRARGQALAKEFRPK